MKFQINKNLRNWLTELNGKTVDKIYQVDFNNERHEDFYLPWFFFITFLNFDKFLEIEGDIDGDHIKINFCDNSELYKKLKDKNLPDEQNLWSVYETKQDEDLGQLLGKSIEFIEYGIDKNEYEINGTQIKGQKDVFNFIRFNTENINLTIFENSGLAVSLDKNFKLYFKEIFDTFNTK